MIRNKKQFAEGPGLASWRISLTRRGEEWLQSDYSRLRGSGSIAKSSDSHGKSKVSPLSAGKIPPEGSLDGSAPILHSTAG